MLTETNRFVQSRKKYGAVTRNKNRPDHRSGLMVWIGESLSPQCHKVKLRQNAERQNDGHRVDGVFGNPDVYFFIIFWCFEQTKVNERDKNSLYGQSNGSGDVHDVKEIRNSQTEYRERGKKREKPREWLGKVVVFHVAILL